jgi:regulator of replication initiation timing
MKDDRGELDLTRQIDELTIRLDTMTKVLETLTEENANLKVIISKLQEEKLELQKQLHDAQYERNIREYATRKTFS